MCIEHRGSWDEEGFVEECEAYKRADRLSDDLHSASRQLRVVLDMVYGEDPLCVTRLDEALGALYDDLHSSLAADDYKATYEYPATMPRLWRGSRAADMAIDMIKQLAITQRN